MFLGTNSVGFQVFGTPPPHALFQITNMASIEDEDDDENRQFSPVDTEALTYMWNHVRVEVGLLFEAFRIDGFT